MRTGTIQRGPSTDEGTFGVLTLDSGFSCVTGELPWRDNEPGKSCVPAGTYMCKMQYSHKHGMDLYHLQNVPNRGEVEIHAANWMGDVDKGFKCELLGCIAPGLKTGMLAPPGMALQHAVISSGVALKSLEEDLGGADFELTIIDYKEA